MTGLLIIAAMVLDFGLARLDRQDMKSQADNAVLAGIAAGDGGTADIYTFRAVCGALANLKATSSLSGLPDDFCANLAAYNNITCSADVSTHAVYDHSITSGGATIRVVIKAPYVLTSDGWSDETKASLAGDQGSITGCDQVGLQIFNERSPGLGSLATDGDLKSGVRSAARATIGGTSSISPALMILERSACSALTVGSAGTDTFIAVKGTGSTPGSIHLDSSATGGGCGSNPNQQLVQGKQANGIVAYGSVSPAGTAGVISSFSVQSGTAANVITDGITNVFGTAATSLPAAVKNPLVGRSVIGRKPIDERYRAAVRTAIAAEAGVWSSTPPASGWTVTNCSPTDAQLLTATRLWINCPSNAGIGINGIAAVATEIYFHGFIKNGKLSMPNATKVWVSNTSGGSSINANAIGLTSADAGFCVRSTCLDAAPNCSTSATPNRARVFVRTGAVDLSGGTLRLCNSTVFMMGGDTATGCVPAANDGLPLSTPCSGTTGNGQITVTGGSIDWTSPNEYAGAITAGSETAAWDNFEDLALWAESAGTYRFSGGGGMQTVGVYMVPNGSPVRVGGGASQNLINAQYFARTFAVTGGGTLSLTTDPQNAVTVPFISGFVLVR